MSTTSVTRSSPATSPMASSRNNHASTSRVSTARITTPAGGALRTPRPKTNRNPSSVQAQDQNESSPNYFSLQVTQPYQSSGQSGHARANFSPPTSTIRSTAAMSPKVVPLDQNPDLAEFRRQSELRYASEGGFFSNAPSAPTMFSPPTNRTSSILSPPLVSPSGKIPPNSVGSVLQLHADKPRSPKRTLSSPYNDMTGRPRRTSPAGFSSRDAAVSPTSNISFLNGDYVNLSLPPTTNPTPSLTQPSLRAETLPVKQHSTSLDSPDGPPFASPAHVVTLLEASPEEVMLLDLRVSNQYARSRIHGALNLCIPTTLLKRPSYNTAKLAETFSRNAEQRQRFERWRSCKYIIVHDANASKVKDALPCVSMLKKFASEGWAGQSYVIRGGFVDFAKQFPNLIEYDNSSSSGSESPPASTSKDCSLPPVIGGCPMPATKSAANPFFGNIRQNMDLIGGVGQISIQLPTTLSSQQLERTPKWLRNVSRASNEGKLASDRFLAIEKGEQKRMQNALSTKIDYENTEEAEKDIRIAGIEKGSKNRYNNIWPYEHTRVKLQGVQDGACDYVNANHVQSAWSNKRYIATQGPIPATFKDFWNMVWQQDARVIVMLTAEMESGQIKAHNYWADKRFGHLRLTFLSESRASIEPARINRHKTPRPPAAPRRSTHSHFEKEKQSSKSDIPTNKGDQPYVIVRRFTLSNSQEPFERMREITQLQYSNWPDFGAPAHPTHLLGLVEQCNKVLRSSKSMPSTEPASTSAESRPIVVHCSAGCGRTGTFCTVDSVIDLLKQQKHHRAKHATKSKSPDAMQGIEQSGLRHGENDWLDRDDIDLVEKTVADFRLQRLSMVQSLRQYVLCYESVLEWLADQQAL